MLTTPEAPTIRLKSALPLQRQAGRMLLLNCTVRSKVSNNMSSEINTSIIVHIACNGPSDEYDDCRPVGVV